MMTKEQKGLLEAWRTIVTILKQTGYDFMYMDEIEKVANVVRKELGLD